MVYCGRNTASYQIKSPVQGLGNHHIFCIILMILAVDITCKKNMLVHEHWQYFEIITNIIMLIISEYSEEGEELPLGPSFQHLISLYL